MAIFEIKDEQLSLLDGSVLLITGGSSGIGLATVELFLSLNAKVIIGDMNPPPTSSAAHAAASYVRTDVTKWKELVDLFKYAISKHGRIDCVFANAGIGPRETYLTETLDEDGDLVEPTSSVLDVNLKGCLNTTRLAIHYMQKQKNGGSIVATASASAYQRFGGGDYTISKHGVLGIVRALYHQLPQFSIRLNAIAPSWTETGLVPEPVVDKAGFKDLLQPPSVVARSVAALMADKERHGELIYSEMGRYAEIDQSLVDASKVAMAEVGHTASDEELRIKLMEAALELTRSQT